MRVSALAAIEASCLIRLLVASPLPVDGPVDKYCNKPKIVDMDANGLSLTAFCVNEMDRRQTAPMIPLRDKIANEDRSLVWTLW
jgi:hypothetical protein